MVIYADIVFLINFFMDTIILFLTSILVKKKVNKSLVIFGAFIGSLLYCLLMFYPKINKFYNPITSIFTIVIPTLLVFKPKSLREFFKTFVSLNICAFLIGGICTALFFYTNFNNYIGELLSFEMNNFSFKLLIFSSSATYVTIKLIRLKINSKMQKKQHIVSVTLTKNTKSVAFNALVDTGNTLREPITNKHVIILEFEIFKDFLPDEIKLIFYENLENDITKIYEAIEKIDDTSFLSCFRLIPFKSIGKENGNLISVKVDSVLITDINKKYLISDVFIAISNFKLTNSLDYNALINPEIFGKDIYE